jgi:hypothetical protein
MDEIVEILKEIGMPYAYSHFAEGESPDPPFICYLLPSSDNFAADGVVYQKIDEVHIELYTDRKDLSVEDKVTAVLDRHGIFYDQTETWIASEKLYEVMFSFSMRR